MSGAALVYSASVRITSRASTHAAGTPDSASAAATNRLLASSPVAAIASNSRGDTSIRNARTMSLVAPNSALIRTVAASRASREDGRHHNAARRLAQRDIAWSRWLPPWNEPCNNPSVSRQRGHDDDQQAIGRRLPLNLLPARSRSPANRRFVGDRRAAEFHDDAHRASASRSPRRTGQAHLPVANARGHSSPSACINSAFRIAAPAAPRIVLWPSATNL